MSGLPSARGGGADVFPHVRKHTSLGKGYQGRRPYQEDASVLVYPNGRSETVLSAKFNFNWQLGYEVEEPIRVPRGTKMIVTAHHDNSANNRYNPDPTKAVEWGDLTSQEMMVPWFGVIVEQDADPSSIAFYQPTGKPSEGLSERTPPLLRLPTQGFGRELPRPEILPPAAPPRKIN